MEKCKHIHMHSQRKVITDDINISFGNIQLERAFEFTYLGLVLTEHLTWHSHISKLSRKIASVVGILSKLRSRLPTSILYKIYFSLIHSRLCYLVGIWGIDNSIFLQHLQSLQNRALKHVHKLPFRFHTLDLYSEIGPNILSIKLLYQKQVCIYIHNTITNRRHSTVQFLRSNHQYSTLETVIF